MARKALLKHCCLNRCAAFLLPGTAWFSPGTFFEPETVWMLAAT